MATLPSYHPSQVRRLVEAVATERYSIVVAAGGGVSGLNAAALRRDV